MFDINKQQYKDFLRNKHATASYIGFDVNPGELNEHLFLFQRDITRWALRRGRAAIFAAVGLGKTLMQLSWAQEVVKYTGGSVLVLAPLAVASQTVQEGAKFGIQVEHVLDADGVKAGINITNYERLDKFDTTVFAGVVLDESSILKNFTGQTKRKLIEAFRDTHYKLACSATPAPNDHMELGNHADFLGVMAGNEMLSRWFINDTMNAGGYRLKHHARDSFWQWLTSWAVCISKPSDLGEQYAMSGYDLPELHVHNEWVGYAEASIARANADSRLFPDATVTATNMHKIKRESIGLRVQRACELVELHRNEGPIVLWVSQNAEADALKRALPEAVEVRGSDKPEVKEQRLRDFSLGNINLLITKSSIAGMGLNWQHANRMIIVSPNYSFEAEHQAIGRMHRFGQERDVHVHMIISEAESNISDVVQRKRQEFAVMQQEMSAAMAKHGLFRDDKELILSTPDSRVESGKGWQMYLGDCVQQMGRIPDESVHLSVFSPPFSELYIYSDSEADMGNAADDYEFFQHFAYLVPELWRVTLPGRLVAIHCKDLPAYQNAHGFSGLVDFPGQIIRMMEMFQLNPVQPPDLRGMNPLEAYQAMMAWQSQVEDRKKDTPGFRFHSRVTIWKDPTIERARTNNHGLLHKNFEERSEATRQGMADYMLIFRKWPIEGGVEVKQHRIPGDYVGTNPPEIQSLLQQRIEAGVHPTDDNGNPVLSPEDRRWYSINLWQKYASPVWWDINQTNVLNSRLAKDGSDEKHICPLQLDVIERCIDEWTQEGETVFSPFAGIGSEGVSALRMKRKFIGIELKESYFNHALKFLRDAENSVSQQPLFDLDAL